MDVLSFSEASTANSRIEKIIANPDSSSGIITVPKVIATGETITIPTGRVAILPNVQVDGALDIQGEVFIPSGATTSSVVEKVASTDNAIVRFDGVTGQVQDSSILIDDSGNLNITGVGKRITGDFSNATFSNRVAFQTSTTNGNTSVYAIPNGTSTTAAFTAFNNSANDNSSFFAMGCSTSSSYLTAGTTGTGTYYPMIFVVGGSERVRIDTAGNVGIGISGNIDKLGVKGNAAIISPIGSTASDGAGVLFFRGADQTQMGYIGFGSPTTAIEFVNSKNTGFNFYNGDMLQRTAYGLGYGAGAGGTVTQLTSKSTAVTLNKPTGQITMNNAALAAGATIGFSFSNSTLTNTDTIVVGINGTLAPYYTVTAGYYTSGACVIYVTNRDTNSRSEAVIINYTVLKGANA